MLEALGVIVLLPLAIGNVLAAAVIIVAIAKYKKRNK